MLKKETINLLKEDFPPESVQVYKRLKDPKTGEERVLTGYRPQYIIERLNEAFGHDGWDFKIIKYENDSDYAYVMGELSIYNVKIDDNALDGPIRRQLISVKQQFGTSSISKEMGIGDAYKGAATNSLEKCASFLDIGHLAYKGLLKIPTEHPNKDEANRAKAQNELLAACKTYKVNNKEAFAALVKNVLKKESKVEDLTVEEIEKLTKHLNDNKAPF